jgi:hypothetical protein
MSLNPVRAIMAKKSMTDIVAAIVDELTPLESDERVRVVRASLALLGEADTPAAHRDGALHEFGQPETANALEGLLPKARLWVTQNALSPEEIGHALHIDDGVHIIEIPGKSNKEKTRNAYVLMGAANLLGTGEAKFTDKEARELCERFGFYDPTNHTKYMKGGNEFTGTKAKGWTLTAPGLKRAAEIVKSVAKR